MSMYFRFPSSLPLIIRQIFLPTLVTCFLYSSSDVLLGDDAIKKTGQLSLSEETKDKEKNSQSKCDIVSVFPVETSEELMDWAKGASKEKRCLLILLSSNSDVFHGISKQGKEKLHNKCYILQADRVIVSETYSIPIETEDHANAVLVCPMDAYGNNVMMIHWVIMNDKSNAVKEMINSEKDLVSFFEEINADIIKQMPEEENDNQK